MKDKEILVFEKLNKLLIKYTSKAQARTHLCILLNHTLLVCNSNQENISNRMSKQDIVDIEFPDNPHHPSCNPDRVKYDEIDKNLKRVIYNNNQIINDFLELGYVPVVKYEIGGGRNNPSYLWLEIEEVSDENKIIEKNSTINKIYYSYQDKSSVKISLFAKPFFDKNNELKMFSTKGIFLILLAIILFFASIVLFFYFIILIFKYKNNLPLNILYSIFSFMMIVIFYELFLPLNNLLTNRIVKSPNFFIDLNQDNADIEFYKSAYKEGSDKEYKIARITEIRSVCPICTAPILLMSGKPDQSAPLVGRCIEAPHAHIYSFDRVLMVGYFLGHPAYLKEQQDT